ncbi:MAG: ImmA/IrrE family metallo-endopeptidase, partial [Angelakisella sp.]
ITQLSGQVAEYDKLMSSLQEIAPCPIRFEAMEGKNGFYNRTENRIAVKEGMSEEQTVKTTIHELAHAKLHHAGEMDRGLKEVQAESVAYVVCQHFGIDSSQYSFGYVASWSDGKDSSVLKDCLEIIRTAAKEVIEDTQRAMSKERTLEREVAPEQEKAEPEKKAAPQKSSKRGVAAKLEAAKQEVAARDAAPRAPQKEQTKSRSVGHDR